MHKTGLWRFSIDGFFLSRRFWWLLYFGCFILFLAGLVCILGFSVLGFGLLILVFFGFLGGLFGLHKAGQGLPLGGFRCLNCSFCVGWLIVLILLSGCVVWRLSIRVFWV